MEVIGAFSIILSVLALIAALVLLILALILGILKRPVKALLWAALITGGSMVVLFVVGALLMPEEPEDETIQRMRDQIQQLQEERDSLSQQLEQAEQANIQLQEQIDELSAAAGEFARLTEDEQAAALAQAEAERIEAEEAAREAKEEADRHAAEQAAEEEKQRQQEEAARLAEEAKGYETGITFEQISRSPDDYRGKKVKFTGYVLEVVEAKNQNEIRLVTSGMYDDILYGTYDPDILDVRLLENDHVTIYGTADGLKTYMAILGNNITLPKIDIDRIELIE